MRHNPHPQPHSRLREWGAQASFLLLVSCFLLLACCQAWAQVGYDYRSSANPQYWKNRPYPTGYWQQDVAYKIDAELLPDENRIRASFTLKYWNNSPDTLTEAFFHLYQNAFTPHSYLHDFREELGIPTQFAPNEADPTKGGTVVNSLSQNGKALKMELNNTILRVKLAQPLLPGDSAVYTGTFDTYFGEGGNLRRRMKVFRVAERQPDGTVVQVPHYDVVLWYPRIAVYDPVSRWNTDQHLGREFYGEFGQYEVNFTLPSHYVLDATGVLTNEAEVLPTDLRKKLDIKNFADKPVGEPADQILAPDGKKKTWRFRALNVHDFALTADPTYRIGEATWNGVRCIALAQETNAAKWQDAADFTAKVIALYSTDFGPYVYPKMIVADARDGMEYPMLTLDGGHSPGYLGLLAHEIGHNWFYGMLGSNETHRAFMDEGFTQFLTIWAMNKLVAKADPKAYTWYRLDEGWLWYINAARNGLDGTLNTHSDDHCHLFYTNYSQVYMKTTAMLFNLQYVLGDELFLRVMKTYVQQWTVRHPGVVDFRQVAADVAKTDLKWFFDQWIETDKVLDYGIKGFQQKNDSLTFTLKRKGEMIMPLDLNVVTKGGDTLRYVIPVSYFAKKEKGLTVLPQWTGLGGWNRTYTATIAVPDKVKYLHIDPSLRLADIYLLDNRTDSKGRTAFKFMAKPQEFQDWPHYRLNLHPNLWWNGFAGLQPGVTLRGDYMGDEHVFRATIWGATGLGTLATPNTGLEGFASDYHKIAVRFDYQTPLRKLGSGVVVGLRSQYQDGLRLYDATLSKKFVFGNGFNPNYHRISLLVRYMAREQDAFADYLIYPTWWNAGQWNATVTLGYENQFVRHSTTGKFLAQLRTSLPGSDNSFAYLRLTYTQRTQILKKLTLRLRLFAQYAEGTLPRESALYLSGGSPEEMYENDFFRARGFFPNSMLDNNLGRTTNHLHYGGGLNLRGYSGYLAEFGDGSPAFVGQHGASFNAELEFDELVPLRIPKLGKWLKLDSYLFADGGLIGRALPQAGLDKPEFARFRFDAGVGAALTIRHPDLSRQMRETIIRFDVPFFLSAPSSADNFVAWRWMIGIGRAF